VSEAVAILMRFEPPIVSESYDPKWERKGSHIKPFPKHHENLTLLSSIKSGISDISSNGFAHFICYGDVRSPKRPPPKKKGKPLGYFRAYERYGFLGVLKDDLLSCVETQD
jgi:hypothetical protein